MAGRSESASAPADRNFQNCSRARRRSRPPRRPLPHGGRRASGSQSRGAGARLQARRAPPAVPRARRVPGACLRRRIRACRRTVRPSLSQREGPGSRGRKRRRVTRCYPLLRFPQAAPGRGAPLRPIRHPDPPTACPPFPRPVELDQVMAQAGNLCRQALGKPLQPALGGALSAVRPSPGPVVRTREDAIGRFEILGPLELSFPPVPVQVSPHRPAT
jgi:hypothetical protein